MALYVNNNVSKLLQKYSFEVCQDSANEELICNKCQRLLNDAYQTYCGCTYCHKCIYIHISEGHQYCNGNKDDCRKEVLVLNKNVAKNVFLNNKILNVKVICPNESCSFNGDLIHIEDHLRRCTKQSTVCPFGGIGCSDEKITTDTIESHIQIKNIEHTRLLMDWIDQFRNESKIEIESLKQKFQSFKEEHIKEIVILKENSVDKEIQMETQRKEIVSLKSQMASIKSRVSLCIYALVVIISVVVLFGVTGRYQEARLVRPENNTQNLNTKNGEITVMVDHINKRMTASKEKFMSPYFYSHNNGYKLRLAVYPGGDGSSVAHLSVGITICKGEYDDQLPWPCKYSFHLSVVNQRSGGTHNPRILSYDTTNYNAKVNYARPISEDNGAVGFNNFISHSELRTIDGLITNDRLIIKCIVTSP